MTTQRPSRPSIRSARARTRAPRENTPQIPQIPGAGELVIICAAIAGAGLGFLWFNTYPAMVFMGDIGALAPGMSADFVSFDLNHVGLAGGQGDPLAALVFCGAPQVTHSIVNGRVVVRDGDGRASRHFVILCFASRWIAGEPHLNEELSDARWIKLEELSGLKTTEGLAEIVAAAFERIEAAR